MTDELARIANLEARLELALNERDQLASKAEDLARDLEAAHIEIEYWRLRLMKCSGQSL
jgi:hypothetical protein